MTNYLANPAVAGAVLHACAVKTAAHATPPTPRQQETEIDATSLATPSLETAYLCRFPEFAVATLIKNFATVLATMGVATHQISTSYFSTVCNSPFTGKSA